MASSPREFDHASRPIHMDFLRRKDGRNLSSSNGSMKQLLTADGQRARVLHVGKFYPPYKGGMETHLQNICRAISPYADVSVIVSNCERETVREMDGDIPVERIGSWANIASAPICPSMVQAIRRTAA